MATQKADYYETLGVGRNATSDDIKRAFRRLAMEYHPDRNSEPGAEARFKEINEAYEVLSDAEKRANYDRFGHAGVDGGFGGSRGFEGFGPFGGFGDIFDAFFGASTQARRRAPTRGSASRAIPRPASFSRPTVRRSRAATTPVATKSVCIDGSCPHLP